MLLVSSEVGGVGWLTIAAIEERISIANLRKVEADSSIGIDEMTQATAS